MVVRPGRVSSSRAGTIGAKTAAAGKYPTTSTTRLRGDWLKMQIRPNLPIFEIAAFGTVEPATELRLDAVGGFEPHGYTVAYPGACASVAVTFSTTADASAGMAARPVTCTWVELPPGRTPIPLDCPSNVRPPGRESNNRAGTSATSVEPGAKNPLVSTTS